MFILKNKILKKISPKNKQFKLNKNNFELIIEENEKLKKINSNLKNENIKYKESNFILKRHNDILIKQNKHIKEHDEKLTKLNTFINFQEFLTNSYVSPIINAPFKDEDKRVFAFMDHITKYLIQNTCHTMNKSLVSIIMPVFNCESIIHKSINSILKQTYDNWELLIIDNGSTDNTSNLLNQISDNRIKILSNNNHERFSIACNVGLKKAKGEYIAYLNPGNEWDSKYIETMIGAFIELPDADALYSGQVLYKDYDSQPYSVCFGSFNKPLLHNKNYIDLNCFCQKHYVYDEIGGFDEKLTDFSEWDYILRVTNNFKIYSIPVLLSKYYGLNSLNRITDEDYYEKASSILKNNSIPPKKYENLSRKVSIIIPSYESLNELKRCINAILSFNLKDMVDIIIVDNNSSSEVKKYLKQLESNQIKLILNNINYGFTYGVKQGIELSDKDSDILILNNDAVLTKGALEHMQYGAYTYSNCGLIVPHELVSEKNPHMNYNVPYADPEFKCDVTPSKGHHNIINLPVFHDGGLLELNFAPFFCVYIKREVYNKTLGFDPELGRHYRSDRIFSDFIRHILKMKIYQEPNAYVYHKHRTATNHLRKNKKDFDFIFLKNQWPLELAEELGYSQRFWDY